MNPYPHLEAPRRTRALAGVVLLTLLTAPWGAAQALPVFDLTNWDGRSVSSASLKGQVTLVAYTYAKCIFACPLITYRLKELDENLKRPQDVRYLHISVNPAEDTADEILLHFGKHGLDPREDKRWLFVNGPRAGIGRLLTEAGIEVTRREVPDGFLIEHTIQVLVVGTDGQTVAVLDTYNWDQEEMIHALQNARKRR